MTSGVLTLPGTRARNAPGLLGGLIPPRRAARGRAAAGRTTPHTGLWAEAAVRAAALFMLITAVSGAAGLLSMKFAVPYVEVPLAGKQRTVVMILAIAGLLGAGFPSRLATVLSALLAASTRANASRGDAAGHALCPSCGYALDREVRRCSECGLARVPIDAPSASARVAAALRARLSIAPILAGGGLILAVLGLAPLVFSTEDTLREAFFAWLAFYQPFPTLAMLGVVLTAAAGSVTRWLLPLPIRRA